MIDMDAWNTIAYTSAICSEAMVLLYRWRWTMPWDEADRLR